LATVSPAANQTRHSFFKNTPKKMKDEKPKKEKERKTPTSPSFLVQIQGFFICISI